MPSRLRRSPRLRRLLACSAVFFAVPAAAQQAPDLPLVRTTFGTIGVIEMPSARMANDGTLSASASYMKSTQHYNLGFQILPWLEGSFRYSGLQHFDPGYPVYWDRSFGVKARLLEEGDFTPAVALGVNDIVGTGIYGGEYLVMSKQLGDFDASVGVGWGRLGTANSFRNPIGLLSKKFDMRPNQFIQSTAGGTLFNTLFHGSAGVFGGLTWHTPLDGLSVSVENSSDAYLFEAQRGSFTPHSQFNYGVNYQLTNGIALGLSYLYGDTISGRLSFDFDPTRPQFNTRLGEQPPAPVTRTPEAQQGALRALTGQRDPRYASNRVMAQARNGFVDTLLANPGVGDVLITGNTLTVTLASGANSQALCRAAAATAAGSDTGITALSVRTSSGKIVARCDVPRVISASLQAGDASIVHEQALEVYQQPITIDASATQPPGDARAAERKFRADVRKHGLAIDALSFTETEAIVYYENFRYGTEADAIDRLTRLLMADAPPGIEKFRLVSVRAGIPQQEYHLLRTPLERALSDDSGEGNIFASPVSMESAPVNNPLYAFQSRKQYPRFDWDIFPQFRQQFFDPSNPLGVQVVGALSASLELAPGLSVWGQAEGNIFDTFNTGRGSDSVLPHVRTDFVRYFSDGKNGLAALQTNYRTKLAPEVYATVRAGYLESMFAGVGGEILYRPDGGRWAIGADIYEVWQRNFNRLFGLQNYKVTTGHVSVYWDSPFYDLNFQVRAGQYLAGDRGLTLQITRRFETGVEIGAFVTKTNVSAADFGEGSFDKGIVIRIPLDWVAPINTQNLIGIDLRPVQRDGGQALLGDATLYEETRRTSQAELVRSGATLADGW